MGSVQVDEHAGLIIIDIHNEARPNHYTIYYILCILLPHTVMPCMHTGSTKFPTTTQNTLLPIAISSPLTHIIIMIHLTYKEFWLGFPGKTSISSGRMYKFSKKWG